MRNYSLQSIFESLVAEADYDKFDNPSTQSATSVGTTQRLSGITGDGENHGIDSGRVKRTFSGDILDELGLSGGNRVNNLVEREFIIAQIFKGLRDRGNRSVRLTYPSMDIIGAVANNPTVRDEDGDPMKKFHVVNTAHGSGEEKLPVYYTINVKVKAANRFGRRDSHNARSDNQQFAGEQYDNPQDYTTAFSDSRIVQKTRDRREKIVVGIGAGLVPQKSASGVAISDKSGTNTVSKHVFIATRPLKVADIARFITRKGAANGIAGHFEFDVVPDRGHPFRTSLIGLMQRLGGELASGTFSGTITAKANDDVVTNRLEEKENPGVDNPHFYEADDIPAPVPASRGDPTDWTGFLSEIAKSATDFSNADEIFGGLDDETVYALYAYYAIPVRLSRIYLCRAAIGDERNAGLTLSHNNIQNKTSSPLAKVLMGVLTSESIDKGRTYMLPNGAGDLFVFQCDRSKVDYPAEWYNNKHMVPTDEREPLSMDVMLVGAVLRTGGRDVLLRLPVCFPDDGTEPFVFMRYGGNDIGPEDGIGDCKSAATMGGGYMFSAKEPIEDISFIAPNMEDAYKKFRSGESATDAEDLRQKNVDVSDGERVNVSTKAYTKRFLRNRLPQTVDDKPKPDDSTDLDNPSDVANGVANLSDAELARLADAEAMKQDKANGDWIDFSKPYEQQVKAFNAKNGVRKGPALNNAEVEQLMNDINQARREDDRTDRDYGVRVGPGVDPENDFGEFDDNDE